MRHLHADEFVDIAEGTRAESSSAHLASCEACRSQLADVRAAMAAAAEADVPEPSPMFWHHLSQRVREAVVNEPQQAEGWRGALRRLSWRRAVVAPLASLAVIALIVFAAMKALAPVPHDGASSGSGASAVAASGASDAAAAQAARGKQGRQNQPPAATTPDGQQVSPAEVRRMFDSYALLQAQDALKISDEQFPKFLMQFKALQELRRKTLQDRNRIVQELRRLSLEQTPNEAQLKDRMKELRDLEEQAHTDVRKAYDGIDQVLDVKQLATGVVDPYVAILGSGRVSGRAVVDLDAVRKQKGPTSLLDPMNYLMGKLPVTATGVLKTSDGVGRFELESAAISRVPVPKILLQEIVSYYSRTPENPAGISLDD